MSRRQITFNVVALVVTLFALFVRREMPAWCLVTAAANGDLAATQAALAAGVAPDARTIGLGHMNALWFAAYKGDPPMARLLLAYGADPTPAWKEAQLTGNPKLLALLLAAGAHVPPQEADAADALCRTAAQTGDLTLLRLLLSPGLGPGAKGALAPGALMNRRLLGDYTMLLCAAEAGKVDACRYLIAHGADVNAVAWHGRTALMTAVLGSPDGGASARAVVDVLLAAGAHREARDTFGKTALDYARNLGYRSLAERLRQAEREGTR